MTTQLALSGAGVPPYSARGVIQTLTPIPQALQMRRTVNATLVSVAAERFLKYASTISCSDQQPPALDGAWPGTVLVVDCVAELCQIDGGTETGTEEDLWREPVPGSIRYESGFVFYRPRLVMSVIGFSMDRDEYGHITNWQLMLEEV